MAPASYKLYMTYQRDLDYIGYGYNELFEYGMVLVFDNFYAAVDIFADEKTPLVPELPTF